MTPAFGRLLGGLRPVLLAGLAATTLASSGQPVYEEHHIDCRPYSVGIDGDLEVWFSASSDREIRAFFYIINSSGQPLEVLTGEIKAEAIRIDEAGRVKRTALRIYTPDDYQELLRRRSHQHGRLTTGGSISMQNKRPGHTGTQERVRGETISTHEGPVIIPPHFVEQSRPPDPKQETPMQPMGPYEAPLPAALAGATLRAYEGIPLRKQTLRAGESGGGVVYIRPRPADSYRITIPLSGRLFEFIVSPPRGP